MPFQRLAVAAGFFAAVLTSASAFASVPSPQASTACAADVLEAMIASPLIDNSMAFAQPHADDERSIAQDPRQTLADFALKLRDIRYRRGGRAPSTGFDCSGFVHYVFASALGIDLPENSASQFQAGVKISREAMKAGDLVFFHMHGKRVSHVGIYLGDGRFIHSPTSGERVRVDQLDKAYWLRHFAGAKRPDVLT